MTTNVEVPGQLSIPDVAYTPAPTVRTATNTVDWPRSFNQFHAANPWILTRLIDAIDSAHQRGASAVPMTWAVEQVKLEWSIEYPALDALPINNNYKAHYRAKIVDRRPDLDTVITSKRASVAA